MKLQDQRIGVIYSKYPISLVSALFLIVSLIAVIGFLLHSVVFLKTSLLFQCF